jgi:flagellar basal-body rod modification protein FlgD
MTIAAVSPTGSTPSGVSQDTGIGKDAFMKLLVTQLKNQDPLNPMNNFEFTAQLAQFTALEQLLSINQSMSWLNDVRAGQLHSQAVSLIGKDVTATGNTVRVSDGGVDPIHFTLDRDAASAFVAIYDRFGNLVREITTGGDLKAGKQEIVWDRKDHSGSLVENGPYTYEVAAVDAGNQAVSALSTFRGRVTGMTFESGTPLLHIGGQNIPVSSVTEIRESN